MGCTGSKGTGDGVDADDLESASPNGPNRHNDKSRLSSSARRSGLSADAPAGAAKSPPPATRQARNSNTIASAIVRQSSRGPGKGLRMNLYSEDDISRATVKAVVAGAYLHSSTSQLNMSRFWSQRPHQASLSRLNLGRLCSRHLPSLPTERAHVKPKSGHM
jgi:hypothetical protein